MQKKKKGNEIIFTEKLTRNQYEETSVTKNVFQPKREASFQVP